MSSCFLPSKLIEMYVVVVVEWVGWVRNDKKHKADFSFTNSIGFTALKHNQSRDDFLALNKAFEAISKHPITKSLGKGKIADLSF